MSTLSAGEEPRQEIIIVRRNHDHDEGHHGGVWKIAFADFMTAMMCFFLVMWLINAANEQTKAAVASYFNPVKLIDRNSNKKGLEELGEGPNAAGIADISQSSPSTSSGEDGKSNPSEVSTKDVADKDKNETHTDEHLFANPYAVLSEIAKETGLLQNVSAKGEGGAQTSGPSTGAQGGEAYRDPFAPDFWSEQMVLRGNTAEGNQPSGTGAAEARTALPPMAGAPSDAAPLEPLARAEVKPQAKSATEGKPAEEINGEASAKAIEVAGQIRAKLAAALGPDSKLAEGLTVVADKKGVTVSVADQFDFGMFEIGSAVPRRDMVLAMEKIGKILSEQKGSLSIEGHTDARPFRNETYDNWRLSTARAHSAYYMLVRGGIDEARIGTVSGHADRRLKDKADPLAAVNRRIDILLEIEG
ncbi:MotB family protein [Mesorhizobium sp. VNQ89]|uniref:MotB family protein n=1 Tax=Mesorhizobium quangtriensis TaxID=3157709 RepID=UPI0032B795E2